MKLQIHSFSIPLARPFSISRGTITNQRTVVVTLQEGEYIGFGEVSESAYYGHSLESITASIESVRPQVEAMPLTSGDALWHAFHEKLADDRFALSALDIAAHDLYSNSQGNACFSDWGLEWGEVPESSLTISIGTLDDVMSQYQENPNWNIYKIKLGGPNDLGLVRALRDRTEAIVRVDANCAWTAPQAIANSHALKELGVEFIEQPLAVDAPQAEHELVFRESALPIMADESCCVLTDVDRCSEAFHGINVKLCKCGGLTPALQMLTHARMLGLRTMVGCMLETSIGISAAAQLLPLLDYADLDGAILLGNDPAEGVTVDRGVVSLSKRPGCGAKLREDAVLPAEETSALS